MTDEEIEKALECCYKNSCKSCPYVETDGAFLHCHKQIYPDSLSYINRLKAEKEQIRKETAKEILSAIKDIDDGGEPFKNYYWFERICRQYGVKVEE